MKISIALFVCSMIVCATKTTCIAFTLREGGGDSGSEAAVQQSADRPSPTSFSSSCKYQALTYGPAVELSPSAEVTLTRNETLLSIDDEDSHDIYDLLKSPPERQKARADKANDVLPAIRPNFDRKSTPIVFSNSPGAAQSRPKYGEAVHLRTFKQLRVLNSSRVLSISRLYGNVFFLTVGPSDAEQYEQLARDLLNGNYCGAPFENLSPEQKQAAEPIARFFLWNSLSSGILDDYEPWIGYAKIAEAFLSKEELADLLEDYAYRAAEIASTDPVLSRVDPDKVWSFAWNAVAKLVQDKDFVKFADLSAYQRDGRIAFMLLGSEPIVGGQLNRFGFYTKPLAVLKADGLPVQRGFEWSWSQDDVRYTASVVLRARQNKSFFKQSAFPADERNGLIVLDATFSTQDIDGVVNEYMTALENDGFVFAEKRPVTDLPRYIGQRFVAAPKIDYLVREGHSDGDDDNVMTVYSHGFVIDGKKVQDGVVENISILVGEAANSKERRIPEYQFATWVNEWRRQAGKPFVYLNTSCWGVEKAWVNLAYLNSARFMEIASRAPVNYFSASRTDAVHIILDGIRHSESFDAVRSKLASVESYSSGHEDRFIFPDEDAYPKPFALLHRSLFARKRGEKIRRYVPNGYF